MITLPPARQASLRSFLCVITLLGGLCVTGVLGLVAPRWLVASALLTLVATIVGLVRPHVWTMWLLYRAWNELATRWAACARVTLMTICYYIVFVAVGRMGSSLSLERVQEAPSTWVPRITLPPATYGSQSRVPNGALAQKGWIPNFFSWAARSGNLWACGLLPFLVLLSALATEQERRVPDNIYTLF